MPVTGLLSARIPPKTLRVRLFLDLAEDEDAEGLTAVRHEAAAWLASDAGCDLELPGEPGSSIATPCAQARMPGTPSSRTVPASWRSRRSIPLHGGRGRRSCPLAAAQDCRLSLAARIGRCDVRDGSGGW